jgi:hypothetical protein
MTFALRSPAVARLLAASLTAALLAACGNGQPAGGPGGPGGAMPPPVVGVIIA